MKNNDKTRKQLLNELEKSKIRIAELEKSETERKKAEQALQKSEQELKAIFNGARDGIALLDKTGKILRINKYIVEIGGFTEEEIVGKRFNALKMFPLKSITKMITVFGKLIKGEEISYEVEVNTKNGEKKIIEIHNSFLKKEAKVERIVAILRDITERKRAEEALRIERDNLKNIFEAMEDGVYIVNQQYDIQYVNPVLIKDFSVYEGRKCYEYFHDRTEVCPWCKNPDVFAGKTVRWEWYSFKNQKTYDLIDTPLKNPDGSISKLEIFRDITERNLTEETLKESEQKLRNIFENSTNLFYSHTPDHILTYLSPQVKDILGYTQEEALIKWTELASDNPINEIGLKHTVKAIETGKPQPPYELELVKKSEEKVWVEVREAPLVKDGKTVSIVGALTDITERKQAEEELAKHREHLEDLIKERTDEVERSQKSLVLLMEDVNEINQELKDVNTMLDVTNKELEAFSYSVSHDLRAPLTRMDGFSKALIDSYSSNLDDKAVHFLNRIRASSQHMAKLIDDLLSLSRITREKVSRQKIDLSQTAGKIVKELKASEPGRQVNFEIAKGLSANADMKFVVIILENLLGNAFKFSGKKKNTIIEFGEKIINEDEVFFIKDNGAGFNMKYYDKIFTAFQRLHSDEEFKGTGIGLAIVQRIINKHGGKIWAESKEGKGTTFYFKFE